MEDIVLITGATSGIGKATAQLLAKEKFPLIITGRRAERLEALKNELDDDVPVKTLSFDVGNRHETHKALDSLPEEWKNVAFLINNAGNAHGLDPFQEASLDDWDTMIDVNVKGLLYVTRYFTSTMIQNNKGHIINIGSIAGKEVYPKGNVYCATKHALDALTQGIRLDLNPYDIKVTAIHPGMVETEFSMVRFKGDKDRADQVYENSFPLYPEDVAESIYFAISRPRHVNIQDMVIAPTAQASVWLQKKKGD